MPRPDLALLNVHYRRIPVMAIGRDVYVDTRIQLSKLESLFPSSSLTPASAEAQVLAKLFEIWAVEGGLFMRGSQLIPSDMPLLKDPKFGKDREDFSGRPWSKEVIDRNRPEALVAIRKAFGVLEKLMSDGREWVTKSKTPTVADIEGECQPSASVVDTKSLLAIFIPHWIVELKGALPKEVVDPQDYPHVWAYIARWNKVVKEAKAKAPKPASLKGDEAAKRVLDAQFADKEIGVNAADPLGLKQGQEVEVWASDMASGFKHRDRGTLVGLNDEEVVISVSIGAAGKDIRLHAPRSGFRVAVASSQAKL